MTTIDGRRIKDQSGMTNKETESDEANMGKTSKLDCKSKGVG